MEAETTYPPTTAYEVLKGFFPTHDLHTVLKAVAHPKSIVLRCSCGDDKLTVNEKMASSRKWSLKEIRHALRNVT
jgi:hypothetical protein